MLQDFSPTVGPGEMQDQRPPRRREEPLPSGTQNIVADGNAGDAEDLHRFYRFPGLPNVQGKSRAWGKVVDII